MKLVWFEGGLLHLHSPEEYLQVIDDFKFDGVMINPFGLVPESIELAKTIDGIYYGPTFLKVMTAGSADWIDFSVVDQVKDAGWVIAVDDGSPAIEPGLMHLKDMGLRTMLVHGWNDYVKDLFSKGLVDYSMTCFYPYYVSESQYETQKSRVIKDVSAWCKQYGVKFVPSIQAFGKAVADWRFPSYDELKILVADVLSVKADGFMFFEPFSGQSMRGELFEGFLSHPEVWSIIENPHPQTASRLGVAAMIALTVGGLYWVYRRRF